MGLDMMMYGGAKYGNKYKVKGNEEIAYWRKHPNLHGYIVNTFADGVDDCRDIPLTKENIENIIQAVRDNKLPHTDGFFFGESRKEYDEYTLDLLSKVLAKMIADPNYKVTYTASW